jgi:hypothetical protein
VQVLDDPALDSILDHIQQDKNRLGENWPGVYAGREHFIYDSGQDSAALGWFKEFEKRPNGIWARDNGLTSLGADAVKNRLYKYTSFVADPEDLEPVVARASRPFDENEGDTGGTSAPLPRYRVKKIETIGFTNHANGKELLTPIANRLASGTGILPVRFVEIHGQDARATNTTPNQGPNMKSVCTLLGLPADAEEAAAHAAVAKLLNRADISADALAALQAEHKSLAGQNQTLLAEQSDALLDACAVRDERIRNRMTDALKLLQNRAERLRYLADFGFAPGEPPRRESTAPATSVADRRNPNGNQGHHGGRVLNRGAGHGAAREIASGVFTDGEQAVAVKIQNRASELQGKGLKFDYAWNQARREVMGRM